MLRNLDRIVGPILGGRDLAGLFEDPAEVCGIAVATAGGNFLQGQAVVLQHELGAIDSNQVQIIVESHEPLLAKQAGNVIGCQAEMFRHALPRNRRMKVFLYI